MCGKKSKALRIKGGDDSVLELGSEDESTDNESQGIEHVDKDLTDIAVLIVLVVHKAEDSLCQNLCWNLKDLENPLYHTRVTLTHMDSLNTFDCIGCQTHFPTPFALIDHLDAEGVVCASLYPVPQIPVPPTLQQGIGDDDVSAGYHPTSGHTFRKGESILDRMKAHKHEDYCQSNPYYPFADKGEWELAKFLALNFMQTQMNHFLKLKWIRLRNNFTIVTDLSSSILGLDDHSNQLIKSLGG